MSTRLSLPVKLIIALGTLCIISIAVSQERDTRLGFKDRLLNYIEKNSSQDSITAEGENAYPYFVYPYTPREDTKIRYRDGDWERYIVKPRQSLRIDKLNRESFSIERESDVNLISYGSAKLNLNYGKSFFTKKKYRQYDTDKPVSKIINSGYYPKTETQVHIEGKVGKRLTLYIDHDSRKKDNQYLMQYRAVEDDEVIREINAGHIDIKVNKSKYAVYDDTSSKGLGIDTTIRKGKLRVKGFGSVTRGETAIEYFKGNSSPGNTTLHEYQYIRKTYYQLEPFKRYDNLSSPPADYYTTITWTSAPADPAGYAPYPVNIDSTGFELYLDDQNPLNDYNAIKLGLDGGWYSKLVSGVDYTINYTTGSITFLRAIPDSARLFAVYTLNGGGTASSDPTARTDVSPFNGKVFVFIKYGHSIHEDANSNSTLDAGEDLNGDGLLNVDIYEIRSFYRIGQQQLVQDNFRLQFYNLSQLMGISDITKLGKYSVDYSSGLIQFYLREPFKGVLAAGLHPVLYAENQAGSLYEYSQFHMRVDYYREARSYQLKHLNIIPNSIRIKVNGRELSPSLYSIDHTSGFLVFTNPNNPVITSETPIEIKYEYLPFTATSQAFLGGFRADYAFSRDLNLGGTFLFQRSSGGNIIPLVGSEPTQTMVLEGDASLMLGPRRLGRFLSKIPGVQINKAPLEIKAYAEYARSYKMVNTFGKGLIDDMESSEEVVGISISDKDWILSSLPLGVNQNERGRLIYKYYRDPDNPGSLKGLGFTPYIISYDSKPGPYNVATGHIADSIQSIESQRSLVMDYDFTTGNHIAVVTRRLSSSSVDFSGLQYIEIIYRADGSSGNADLFLDIGKINEDSDGDSLLDTEDDNMNGFLDSDPGAGIFEDRGYRFNPSGGIDTWIGTGPKLNSFTQGDGVLNTEDLNGNGVLNTTENSIRIPGNITTIPALTVDMSDTSWKVQRIYIDRSSVNFSDKVQLLKEVEAVRLYLRNNTAVTGRIFIDSIRFVSSRWRNIKINGVVQEDPTKFNVTMVNSITDSDYRSDAFLFKERGVYTSLHGDRSDDELSREKETALQIEYNLGGETEGSVTRRFSKPIDLRFYKGLAMWLNIRPGSVITKIGVRVGSSENDYLEYEVNKGMEDIWQEVKLNLQTGKGNGIDPVGSTGYPDSKRVTYMELIIYSSGAGKVWINDIYGRDAETLVDDAYWFEAELRGKRPLFRTKSGVPVISDIYLKYIEKGHGSQFSTLGKPTRDIMEKYRQIFSSVSILPNWKARMDVLMEESQTDSLNEDVEETRRGMSEKRSLYLESDYTSITPGIPSIKLIYKNDIFENRRMEFISSSRINQFTENRIHSPSVIVKEDLEKVMGGRLTATLSLDMSFKHEKIRRSSPDLGESVLENLLPLQEIEKRQKGKSNLTLNYRNKYFYVQPSMILSSQEIVGLRGKSSLGDTEILGDVSGDYHFPFFNGDNVRYVERNKKTSIRCGLQNIWLASPSLFMDLYYYENKFRDYSNTEKTLAGPYSRAKDATSYISSGIAIPLNFHKTKKLKFIRNLSFSYRRSLFFQENEIPYEGEGRQAFEERYGISRAISGISGAGLNYFKYFPWYFFMGRSSFANGRDYTYNNLNSKLYYPGGTVVSDYTNSLRLIDNYSLSGTVDFDRVILTMLAGLNQISERQTVEGIPSQVVTYNASSTITLNLMRIFSFGFFRPNSAGKPHHSATASLGYEFRRNMLITSNIQEDTHAPTLGITFKWDRTSLGLKTSFNYRRREQKEYISYDEAERSDSDDIYIDNMALQSLFKEIDKGYSFAVLYETDVKWVYRMFSSFYKLVAFPIFSLEYSLILNRYDYTETVSPEPYDQHLVTSKLTLDLHKNVRGGVQARWALEKFRNRDTEGVSREIMSYDISLNFSLIF